MREGKTIVKGSFWIMISNLLIKFIGFLYTVIIARLLVPEEVGIFYLALSVLGILYIFTDLGLLASLGRYVPYFYGRKEIGKLRELIKLSYFGGGIFTLLFSAIVFLLSGSIANFIGEPTIEPILQMLAIWLFLKEIYDVNKGILNGRKKLKESRVIVDGAQNFVKLIVTLLALYVIGFNAGALSIALLISFVITIPLGIYLVIKEMRNWKKQKIKMEFTEKISLGKEVVHFGIILTLIEIMYITIQYMDRIMIGYFLEESLGEIAIYSMAIGLANLVLIFPGALTGIFSPLVAELYGRKEKKEISKTLEVSTKWIVMFMIPIVLVMGLFSENLLNLFYGSTYQKGSIVLVLFAAGLFIKSIFILPSAVFAAIRRLDVEGKAITVAAISNVLLNIFLIPLYGINGAATASFISLSLMGLVIYYYSRKIINFRIPTGVYKSLLAGSIGFILIFILKSSILLFVEGTTSGLYLGESQGQLIDLVIQKIVKLTIFGIIFGIASSIYLFTLILLRSFGKEEIEILEAGLRKAKIPNSYIKITKEILEAKYLGKY